MTCQINLNLTVKYLLTIPPFFYKVFHKHVSRATLNKDLELINNFSMEDADRNKQDEGLYFF